MSIIKTLSTKISLLLGAGMLAVALLAPVAVLAQDPFQDFGLDDAQNINVSSDQNTDLKQVIANVVNIALGFLGILAVIIIIYAGFKWMTASGNDDQVSEARKMLVQAVIGLAIIFLAWVIVNFAVTQLSTAVRG